MTAGTIFLMWVGEQIDEYGIGNGISLLIMAGILARMPLALKGLWDNSTPSLSPEAGKYGIITIVLLAALFVAVVVGVIAITESQRRIPTQSAKHVRGRRVFGGTPHRAAARWARRSWLHCPRPARHKADAGRVVGECVRSCVVGSVVV